MFDKYLLNKWIGQGKVYPLNFIFWKWSLSKVIWKRLFWASNLCRRASSLSLCLCLCSLDSYVPEKPKGQVLCFLFRTSLVWESLRQIAISTGSHFPSDGYTLIILYSTGVFCIFISVCHWKSWAWFYWGKAKNPSFCILWPWGPGWFLPRGRISQPRSSSSLRHCITVCSHSFIEIRVGFWLVIASVHTCFLFLVRIRSWLAKDRILWSVVTWLKAILISPLSHPVNKFMFSSYLALLLPSWCILACLLSKHIFHCN